MTQAMRQSATSSYLRRFVHVIKAWGKHPGQVATLFPSSPLLTAAIANRDCIQSADVVVELGPGAGGTTLALLDQMKPASRLLAIEKTPVLFDAIREIHDPRLSGELGDAVDLIEILQRHQLNHLDVVVSGIPFSAISDSVGRTIVESIYKTLRSGGTFIAYQFCDEVKEFARPLFGPPHTEPVLLNVPPLWIYSWSKVASSTVDPAV